jgi:hypothetical protein
LTGEGHAVWLTGFVPGLPGGHIGALALTVQEDTVCYTLLIESKI